MECVLLCTYANRVHSSAVEHLCHFQLLANDTAANVLVCAILGTSPLGVSEGVELLTMY